ncbi:MAG: sodium/solute symporter [Acidobacteriota bacterium]|nr:sodium/solute symporter [Acidobacteriota bacterium]
MKLTAFEIGTFVFYLAAVVAIGFVSGKKGKDSTAGFFLAGRRLPWYVIGFSLIAASISSEQFIGEVGWGYKYGMAVANWEWLVWPAQALLLLVFLPIYLKNKIFTVPEYLTRRFGRGVGTAFSIVCMIQYTAINLPLVLYSGGFLINRIYGMNLYLAVGLLVVITGSYTIFGGLSSAAWVDLFNGALLIGGGLLVFILGMAAVPGGLREVLGAGDRAHLILPASHPDLPWTGILAVAVVMSGYYYSTNQYITQRCLGAKSHWNAKMGIVLAAALAIPLGLGVTWPGMIARALNPGLPHPDGAYPYLVGRVVPVGLRGVVFAVLFGAIISTVDSLINSTSSLLTLDIYKGLVNPRASEDRLVRFGRWTGTLFLVFGAVWSPMVGKFGSIFSYAQDCWALMLAPVMAVFVLAVFWKRMTRAAAIAALLAAVPMLVLVYLRQFYGLLSAVNIFNLSGIIFLASLAVIAVVSRLTPAPPLENIRAALWDRQLVRLPEEEVRNGYPWWKRTSLWFAAVVACFIVIYAIFW